MWSGFFLFINSEFWYIELKEAVMNSAGTIPQISFDRQHSPCDIYFLQMIYRLRTCCDFSPNCKQIKQSWLTETKILGYFLLWGSLTKPSSLNTPTSFACKSLCLKRSYSPSPNPGALQRHQRQCLPTWGTSLINQKRWMETNQTESFFGFSFLPAWVKSDARRGRHAEMHEASAVKIL